MENAVRSTVCESMASPAAPSSRRTKRCSTTSFAAMLKSTRAKRRGDMPYPSGHRDETKARIVRTAQRLFNMHGFEAVSMDRIMGEAKLTRGGFYRYFASKSDLYAEAMDCFFTNPAWGNRWEGVEVHPRHGALGPQIVRAYLSRQHYQDREDSCPMV